MNILFIQPYMETNFPSFIKKLIIRSSTYPSHTLLLLASITPKEHFVKLVDEQAGQQIDYDNEYEVVGITCCTANAHKCYEIADEFRRRGITVVLGGYHPTALPEEAKQHADSVVIGEAEVSWPILLKDLENGKLKPFYKSGPIDPKLIPSIRRDDFEHSVFSTSIEATRGCPIGCKFCSASNVEGSIYRTRPIENVVQEIESIKQKMIFFNDCSLTININYTKSLFREMRKLNKKITCFGNINIFNKDDEFLSLANKAGCIYWNTGIESFSQKTINNMRKITNKVKEYNSAIKKIKDYGMNVTGAFMFGFDTDTPSVFNETSKAIYDLDVGSAVFSILTPFPGTPIFNELDKEGRILTKDWSRFTTEEVVYKPKNFSPENLFYETCKIAREFYEPQNTIRRIAKSTKHGITSLMLNFFKNREYNSYLRYGIQR